MTVRNMGLPRAWILFLTVPKSDVYCSCRKPQGPSSWEKKKKKEDGLPCPLNIISLGIDGQLFRDGQLLAWYQKFLEIFSTHILKKDPNDVEIGIPQANMTPA